MSSFTALAATTMSCIVLGLVAPSLATFKPIEVGSEKQLFIDELFIETSHGVRLVVNRPQKTGERNIVPEHAWELRRVGYPNTVMEDQGKYRMWYDAWCELQPGDTVTQGIPPRVTCYAESDDGVHWKKPVVGSYEFRGSRQNNIVLPTSPGTVFIDPNAPASERYKFFGRNRSAMAKDIKANAGLWIFGSPDGFRFDPLFSERATDIRSDTHDVAFWDPVLNKYVAYIKYIGRGDLSIRPNSPIGALGNRKIWRMETNDLKNWPEPAMILAMDAGDRKDSDLYNSAAIRYPYAARAYFMFPSAYYYYVGEGARLNDGPLDIQFAASRDGIHFSRPDRHPFVRNGLEGSFDSRAMYMGVGMLRRGDELWMYYVGYDFTHGDTDAMAQNHKGVISRLVLRLDGFMSADADYQGGEIVSRPILFNGQRLELNMDASAGGAVQVEILDAQMNPIPGFTLDEADILDGNSVRRVVTWKGKSDVSALIGKPIRLRWKLRDVKLYAFQFMP